MDSIPTWAYFLFVAIISIIAIWYRVIKGPPGKKRRELLQEQALKRNGTVQEVEKDHFFERRFAYSKLIFSHSGFTIEIYTEEKEEVGDFTYAKASFKLSKDVDIKLYKRRGVSKLYRQDIQTGNPEFDDVFYIKASDKNFAGEFFTPKVQHKLLSLKKWDPSLRITQTELVLEIWSAPFDSEGYDNFIDTALSLFESLQRQEMLYK